MESKLSLTAEERETIISWCDTDKNQFFIYSSQQPMIRKILRNPLFECKDKRYNKAYTYHPDPISVEGYLPLSCLTIRKKKRRLTPEQKEQAIQRLAKARDSRSKKAEGV